MSWRPANQPSRVPGWVPVPVRWALKWGSWLALILLCVALYYVYLASGFDMRKVAKMPEHSVILDRNGKEFAFIHGERRQSITREEIPDTMVKALYAREDLHFPEHSGIDVKGLVRATLRNIKDWSFTQGASTLTMQLARNTYDMRAKSLHRKFLEIALTLRIEQNYSKDEILTLYLNRIYFGAGCHGVGEASETYFGRPPKALNLGECAMLVGIIRGPHVFCPFRNWEAAVTQRDEVLDRMVRSEFLTEEEAEEAKLIPIRLVPEKERSKGSSYAKENIRYFLQIILAQNDIRDGGLKIFTTLDADLQRRCDPVISGPIPNLDPKNQTELGVDGLQAAMVKLDVHTGGILAICGGRSFQESPFNRAYRAKRDLGPAFTPFLSALAKERGKVAIPGKPVQTGRQLGVKETIRLCKRLDFSGPYQKTEDLYRGAIGVTPMELAVATSILANEGKKPDPHFILKIIDQKGDVLYSYEKSNKQAISKNAAKDAFADFPQSKGVKGEKGAKQLVTTTGSRRDAWGIQVKTLNLNPVVTILWMGYDTPKRLGDSKVIVNTTQEMLERLR